MRSEGLELAVQKMQQRGTGARAVAVFEEYWRQLEDGAQGTIPEDSISPLVDVPELRDIDVSDAQRAEALTKVAIVKLNGGLGTGMGMSGPKSALVARDGLTFLDIIARQTLALRDRYGTRPPVVLMNSFRTREDSMAILQRYPELVGQSLPGDFLQSAEPKLDAETLAPISWPEDPSLEWCPPGHGDVYLSLDSSGLLQQMLDSGIEYVFLSNADNLGATCDPDIAAWLLQHDIPYAAEVTERTANDRKGGHLAVRLSDERLILRDSAQVVDGEDEHFQDTGRHGWFNTNNLWVGVRPLQRLLESSDGGLGLPIIINRKTVDPARSDSPAVIQIESAMGTAIERFEGSQAIRVPRSRFRPVKTTNELLLLRSDVYELTDQAQIVTTTTRRDPTIRLGAEYKVIADFDARFPHGPPSLRECESFTVEGDVNFGAEVVCQGAVTVRAPEGGRGVVSDGTVLSGDVTADPA